MAAFPFGCGSWWGKLFSRRALPLGVRGERAAEAFLAHHRHRTLRRNYRCAAGEIDLICRDAATIVFVEIKTRASDEHEDVTEAIHPAQWRRIERAARHFLRLHRLEHRPARFDLVTVIWSERKRPTIEHHKDAYLPTRRQGQG